MGSPSASLNIPEFMRPWYQSGLQLLFRDSLPEQVLAVTRPDNSTDQKISPQFEGRAGAAEHQKGPSSNYNQQQAPATLRGKSLAHRQGQEQPHTAQNNSGSSAVQHLGNPSGENREAKTDGHNISKNSSGAGNHFSQAQAPTENQSKTPQHFKQTTEQARPTASGNSSHFRAPIERKPLGKNKSQTVSAAPKMDWPDPWNKMAQHVSGNVQIFWTYSSLALDLSGHADPERRKLFQSLIVHMGLPKGSIAFWPCTKFEGGQVQPNSDIFWKGVQNFGVKFVACFGDEARDIIAPDVNKNSSTLFVKGIQVVTLSDPDFMKTLEGDAHLLLATPLLRLPLF